MVLKELCHACSHSGIHCGSAVGIDANAFTGVGKCVLGQRHEYTDANLHGVAVQSFNEEAIDAFAVLSRIVRHLEHDAGILVHDPQAAWAFHAEPSIFRRGAQALLPEELIAQLASAPLGAQASQQRFPGLCIAKLRLLTPSQEVQRDSQNGRNL